MIKLALIIPVYNDLQGLNDSLLSIHTISNTYLEVVVIDDGSTIPLSESALQRTCECKVTLISRSSNEGVVSALNAGLDYAMANDFDFIARLDSGDLCLRNRLSKQLQFLKTNRDHLLVGSNAIFINGNGSKLFEFLPPKNHNQIQCKMHLNNCFCHPTIMYRVCPQTRCLRYNKRYEYAEDYHLFWKILRLGKSANIPEALVTTVANPRGISRSKRKEQLRLRMLIQIKNFNPGSSYSYFGIFKTLVLMVVPLFAVDGIKSILKIVG